MLDNGIWSVDETDLEKAALSVDAGTEAIAGECWIIEDYIEHHDNDGNFRGVESVFRKAAFQELTVPDTVKVIHERAFYRMPTLRKLSILNNVTEIGKEAFKGCEQLSEVVAPKVRVSDAKDPETKLKLAAGFCSHEELYAADVAEDYLKYLKTNRKKLWQEPVFLHKLLEKQLIPLAELDGFLENAAETASAEVRSMLLEYKNAAPQETLAAVADKKEKAAERALMREKPTAAELKKLWSVKKVDTGTIELTAYHGTEEEVEIPDVIGKQTVVRLSGTFKGNETLQSVFIPKTVTEITSGAFDGCSRLTAIDLPDKLKLIGTSVFRGCSRLTSITLPKSVTKIGSHFAANCVALLELHLSDKIREIPYDILEGCVNLEELYLPEKCRIINNFAFNGLKALKRLHIPGTTDKIGYDAVVDCPNLTIHTPAGSCGEQYAKEHGIPFVAE